MILYHIDKWKYRHVWPPEGTLHGSGRWNEMGQWLIYCSPTISLAKLEILANESFLPLKRVCMTIEVPDDQGIYIVGVNNLKSNWMAKPYPDGLLIHTQEFLNSDHLLMKVPSAQSYREFNYLINVRHSQFHKTVKLVSVESEPFDPRLKT